MTPDTLTTLAAPAAFHGVGLHSGRPASIRVLPARAGSGILFRRTDQPGRPVVRAAAEATASLALCTTLRGGGAEVSTVEHLLAALAGLAIDDAEVEVDGPEIPILDGSSAPFAEGLLAAGLRPTAIPRRHIRVLRPVEAADGGRVARLEPHDGFAVSVEIDFAHPAIGRSALTLEVGKRAFRDMLAGARTFCLLSEVEAMRSAGRALGGSLENAVVVGPEGVLNTGGLRFADEFVRHKALDALGDLYLAGAPLLARYVGVRAGHALNNALLRRLLADGSAWEWAGTPVGRAA